jgi:hypothetical protein
MLRRRGNAMAWTIASSVIIDLRTRGPAAAKLDPPADVIRTARAAA